MTSFGAQPSPSGLAPPPIEEGTGGAEEPLWVEKGAGEGEGEGEFTCSSLCWREVSREAGGAGQVAPGRGRRRRKLWQGSTAGDPPSLEAPAEPHPW